MTTTDELPASVTPQGDRRRWLILAICCMSLLMVSMDATIVNVALPSIKHDLHASVSGLQWIIDAYTLVLAMLLMLSGSTADRLGRKQVFQIGLATFTLGSLLCSLAPALGWLIAFRAMQAIGGSMLNPVAMSIIVNVFKDRKERAKAIGFWGAVVGISLALGPVVGGALVSSVGWRAIFWINIPIGVAAIFLTQIFVPTSRAEKARRIDPIAQVLLMLFFGSLVYGIIEGPDHGWHSPLIIGLFCLSLVSVVALVRYETRRPEPLVDPRFFRSAPFSGATIIALAAFAGFGGFLFLNTLYLQTVRGYSPIHAGLLTLPMAAMAGVFAPLSGKIVGTRGPRLPLLIAGPGLTIGALILTGVTRDTSLVLLLLSYVIFGIGFGMVNAPITNTAMAGMPLSQAGVAAATASTSRQIGASLGVAITGSLVASSAANDLATASHAAWAVIVGCGVLVVIVGLVSTGKWAGGTAERARYLLEPTGVKNEQSNPEAA
jgi:EmrB/QacA subfamily drug resistance transporter